MHSSFKNILIPVDLSINTELAVKKGLEFADNGAVIHLLYVQSYSFPGFTVITQNILPNSVESRDHFPAEEKLKQWKLAIEESHDHLTVCTWIMMEDSIQKAIEKTARKLAVDLVIIGKNSRHSWFPFLNTVVPGKITQKTGITVLTIKPGSIRNKIRSAIVPVAGDSTKHKMEALSMICRKFKIKIYLVTFMDDENKPSDFSASSLLQIYQWLKTTIHYPVEYAVLHGRNKAKAVLNYAQKINADILLVHPGTETKIGWPNKHISDVLPATSRVQVLAVGVDNKYN